MPDDRDVPALVIDALAALTDPRPMGSVSVRRVKCSKPGCACATDPDARHGPYVSLTRAVGGTTRSRLLTAEHADLARDQVAVGRTWLKSSPVSWIWTSGQAAHSTSRPTRRPA